MPPPPTQILTLPGICPMEFCQNIFSGPYQLWNVFSFFTALFMWAKFFFTNEGYLMYQFTILSLFENDYQYKNL